MSSGAPNMAPAVIAAVGVGAGGTFLGLPFAFCGFLSVAIVVVGYGMQTFLKVAPPPPPQKKKKMTKQEKQAAAKAAAPKPKAKKVKAAPAPAAVEDKPEELTKAQKKKLKDREKKAAKKAEEAKKKAEEAKAAAAEAAAASSGKGKKKKKKKKKEAAEPKKAAKVEESDEEVEAEETGEWNLVPKKVSKKKVQEAAPTEGGKAAPAHTIELDIAQKEFPKIIGPGGRTINAIKDATGTEIEMPKKGGMRTAITVSGTKAGCMQVKANIEQLVAKGYCEITHAGHTDEGIEVKGNKRSLLIGPSGANIRAIQEATGAKINMPDRGSDSDTVQIVGDAASVRAAKAAIQQLITQGYSDITHENYTKTEMEVPRDMLRVLIGQAGATIRGLQDSTKTRINIPSDSSDEVVMVSIMGEAAGVAAARAQISQLLIPAEPEPTPEEWTQSSVAQQADIW